MGKIISKYENDLDKCWFESSNVLYSECDDKNNQLKTVRITFKDGTMNITMLLFKIICYSEKAHRVEKVFSNT